MAPKNNPLKLNGLQLRTLTVLQALSQIEGAGQAGPGEGEITINRFPQAHADHFHLGDALVMGSDCTGLFKEAVWHALERKGLARADWPNAITLKAEGIAYDTGLVNEILKRGSH